MIHLDTSFLVDLLREMSRGEEGPAAARLVDLGEARLGISIHTLCELQAGAELSRDPKAERIRVSDLVAPLSLSTPTEEFASTYASLLAELERRGERIATMDLLIAAAAVADEAALVTRDTRDFERVPGLRVLSY